MFIKKSDSKSGLDEAIDSALAELNGYEATDKEYAETLTQLEKLYAIRDNQRSGGVSKDTLAIVIGNLVGIFVVVGHERAHVVTSKALGMLIKSR